MRARGVVALLAAVAACAGAARADERPSIGLTLNATIGTHQESGSQQRLPVVPAPVLDLRVPFKQFEVEAEGFPAIGPIGYNSGINVNGRGTKISYVFGILRYRIPN